MRCTLETDTVMNKSLRWRRILLVVLPPVLIVISTGLGRGTGADGQVWPGPEWQRASPAGLGMLMHSIVMRAS